MARTIGNPARIGEVFRRNAGAVEVVFKDDIKVEEMAAVMHAVTNTAREMGWPAGQLMAEYLRLEEAAKNRALGQRTAKVIPINRG